MVVGLLPPTKIADTKTPSGLSHSSASTGHCDVETVNLQFGCAAGDPFSGVQSSFFHNHAISSPTVSTFQPGSVGTSIDKLVFPQALGNAPKINLCFPSGFVIFKISICSAIHISSLASTDAMRSAKHFFPKSAFPP